MSDPTDQQQDEVDFPRIETRPYDEEQKNERGSSGSSGSSTPTTPGGGKPPRRRRPSSASSASSQGASGGRSIQVYARFRPENALEVERGGVDAVKYDPDGKKVSIKLDYDKGTETHDFKFESILPPNTTQEEVYARIGAPVTEAAFQGINTSVLSFGQTGSGKTYTTMGQMNDRGVVVDCPGLLPRLFNDIFDKIQSMEDTHDCVFNFSFVELYMERLRDLLAHIPLGRSRLNKKSGRRPSTASGGANDEDDEPEPVTPAGSPASNISPSTEAFIPKDVATAMKTDIGPPPTQVERWRQMHAFGGCVSELSAPLEIRDAGKGNLYITNTTSVWVQNQADAMTCVQKGLQYRTTAATKQNAQSSRSHAILVCTLIVKDRVSLVTRQSQLYIVDLAGSERVSKSETEGLAMEEAKSINVSLFALGQVINALAERASKKDPNRHVPYRDSKLTRLLENSLSANALSYIICTCSPSTYNAGETISTLTFGAKSSLVKTQPRRNESQTVEELTYLLEKAKAEIEMQKAQINMLKRQVMKRNDPTASSPTSPASPGSSSVIRYGEENLNNGGGSAYAKPGTRMFQVSSENHEQLIEMVKTSLQCPLTGQTMKDPVFCLDGNTYERAAIFNHLVQNDMMSPLTGQRVMMSTLTPNSGLKVFQHMCHDQGLLVANPADLTRYESPFMAWYPVYLIVSYLSLDERLWLATLNSQFARRVYDRDMWEEPVKKLIENASDEVKRHVKNANLPAHKVYVMLKRNAQDPSRLHQQLQRYIISPSSPIALFSSKYEKEEKKRYGKKKE